MLIWHKKQIKRRIVQETLSNENKRRAIDETGVWARCEYNEKKKVVTFRYMTMSRMDVKGGSRNNS